MNLYAAALLTVFGIASAWAGERTCSLGVVPQFEQRRIQTVWQPIAEALSAKTGCRFEWVGSSTISDFEKAFANGEYDFAYMNPYHAVMAHTAQGYVPLVRSGTGALQGILVVRADSGIDDIHQLDGETLAFPSPNALGASLLMRAELHKQGINLTPLYVKTHSSVYLNVAKELTKAGGGVARTLQEQPAPVVDALKVIYRTHKVSPHPLVGHPRVTDLHAKVQQAWLELARERPELFEKVPMQEPVAATYDDYRPLEAMGLENFVGDE